MGNEFSPRRSRQRPTSAKDALQIPKIHQKKLTFLIDAELHRKLRFKALEDGKTMTEIISSLISGYVEE